jgi:menaquinone-9 beta-reductase
MKPNLVEPGFSEKLWTVGDRDRTELSRQSDRLISDVVVVGAGPGGLGLAISLARAGRKVVCIDPEPFPRVRVGESLDWSAPALLKALGLPRDMLIEQGVGTVKRKIRVEALEEPHFGAQPDEYEFLTRKPFEFEVVTLHVDRTQMDARLFRIASELGVIFVWDRVTDLEVRNDQILACCTEHSGRFTGQWFIDASGRAQSFAKALAIPKIKYGRPKVCLWSYFKSPCEYEGTTFYTNGRADYLSWIWKIPITPNVVSVGYVGAATNFRASRGCRQSGEDFLRDEMARFPGLRHLHSDSSSLHVLACSWQSYVQSRVSGSNWLLVGESAAVPDPLTSNGVSAALRHADQAAQLILEANTASRFRERQQRAYETNVRRMGNIFNYCIERAIYEPRIRKGMSTEVALRVYAHFGYLVNALFAKFEPRRSLGLYLFGLLLVAVRVWIEFWVFIGTLRTFIRQLHQSGKTYLQDSKAAPRV